MQAVTFVGMRRHPGTRLSSAAVGRRADPRLAQSLSSPVDTLGEESRLLPRHAALCLRHHHLAGHWPTGIGSNTTVADHSCPTPVKARLAAVEGGSDVEAGG
ncbi:hypothetical protein p2A317 (plasmid) [Aromatoleum aromaticum EbN1]|uniref:Uncharacterized protein n=1 Tax=Aromatoleum aromaticum (strain DSM 19018 / LMG 30748 / EbN1) TaxID=76114 RepID=Q5NW87_AROAE|nr:hypothetical protein p2A317 [Aromatoleum aromaticum EbN1]